MSIEITTPSTDNNWLNAIVNTSTTVNSDFLKAIAANQDGSYEEV